MEGREKIKTSQKQDDGVLLKENTIYSVFDETRIKRFSSLFYFLSKSVRWWSEFVDKWFEVV